MVNPPDEMEGKLYRAVRGELPRTFWLKDGHGQVCAIDAAFMSTSRNSTTPIGYMDRDGPNVLWELHPRSGWRRRLTARARTHFMAWLVHDLALASSFLGLTPSLTRLGISQALLSCAFVPRFFELCLHASLL